MLTKNLLYLRKKSKRSQQELADQLGLPRTTLGDYERGNTEPNIAMLIKLADTFQVSIDELVRTNISHKEYEVIKNKNMKVLAITVDKEKKGNIELVESKAEAGYLESFQDPEYIKDLPQIYFPKIPSGTYRGFEINGDSMLPMESGSIVVCSYIEKLANIKNEKTYVVISKQDGLVYKRIRNNKKEKTLSLISDNQAYLPYEIPYQDIAEVWEYYAHLNFSDLKISMRNEMENALSDIQRKVTEMHLLSVDSRS